MCAACFQKKIASVQMSALQQFVIPTKPLINELKAVKTHLAFQVLLLFSVAPRNGINVGLYCPETKGVAFKWSIPFLYWATTPHYGLLHNYI